MALDESAIRAEPGLHRGGGEAGDTLYPRPKSMVIGSSVFVVFGLIGFFETGRPGYVAGAVLSAVIGLARGASGGGLRALAPADGAFGG